MYTDFQIRPSSQDSALGLDAAAEGALQEAGLVHREGAPLLRGARGGAARAEGVPVGGDALPASERDPRGGQGDHRAGRATLPHQFQALGVRQRLAGDAQPRHHEGEGCLTTTCN